MTVYVAAKAYAEKLREAVAITFLALEGQFVLTGQLSGSGPNAALLQTCACWARACMQQPKMHCIMLHPLFCLHILPSKSMPAERAAHFLTFSHTKKSPLQSMAEHTCSHHTKTPQMQAKSGLLLSP